MAFSKTIFVDSQTVIDADTLNAIQDELIWVAGLLGKDIQSAAINDSGHLILTLTDGTTLDAGVAKGATGPAGPRGPAGPDGVCGRGKGHRYAENGPGHCNAGKDGNKRRIRDRHPQSGHSAIPDLPAGGEHPHL